MVYVFEPETNVEWEFLFQSPYGAAVVWGSEIRKIPLPPPGPIQLQVRDGSAPLPDLFEPRAHFNIASERFKAVIEANAPGCAIFYPADVEAPPKLRPAPRYYYFQVIGRAQRVDWLNEGGRSNVLYPRTPCGKKIYQSRMRYPSAWKPRNKLHPHLWCEVDLETSDSYFTTIGTKIFISDELWKRLNFAFPENLRPIRLPELGG